MIKHIVMIKLKEFETQEEYEEKKSIIREKLEDLTKTIPEVKSIEVGLNIVKRPTAYDISLIAKFDDLQGLNKFRENIDHLEALNVIFENTDKMAVVDYDV